jgi:hypothetical protein
MEYSRKNNGWGTFMAHWWPLIVALIAISASQVLSFFTHLNGTRWIYFFIASEALLFLGGGLIVRAKIPVYRDGRFFTFGLKSVPRNLAGCYRWGWSIFLFGVVLSLGLLLSKP